MNIDELKRKIDGIMKQTYTSQMYFVLRQDDKLITKLADIEDERSEPAIRQIFSNELQNAILSNEDLSICNLSSTDERANTLYFYDYEQYPEELGIFKDFTIASPGHPIQKFDFTTDDLRQLYGYVICLGTMDNHLLLFKKHYPISLIKRDAFLLGMIPAARRFEVMSGEDIIRLNGSFQLLRIGKELFIVDVKMLERNMGFAQLVQRAACESISAIKALDILEDIEVLTRALEDAGFTRKLSKIKPSSPIFKSHISADKIIDFTKNTPALSGKFKYTEDGKKIRLATKKSKIAFLKLMNDAFLHSELTKLYYEASAKDTISVEEA